MECIAVEHLVPENNGSEGIHESIAPAFELGLSKMIKMLEKPDIPEERIISRLQEEYDLQVAGLDFLPHRGRREDGCLSCHQAGGIAYFLKLRKVSISHRGSSRSFSDRRGSRKSLSPFETKTKGYWADFESTK